MALPYEAPERPGADPPGLEALARWYGAAAEVLEELRSKHSALRPGPGPVRLWPHHFDIAVLVGLDEDGGESARSIGVGVSPGDGYYAQPYAYVSPYPAPKPPRLPALPPAGRWHTRDFFAAVATADDLLAQADPRAALVGVIDAAFEAFIGLAQRFGDLFRHTLQFTRYACYRGGYRVYEMCHGKTKASDLLGTGMVCAGRNVVQASSGITGDVERSFFILNNFANGKLVPVRDAQLKGFLRGFYPHCLAQGKGGHRCVIGQILSQYKSRIRLANFMQRGGRCRPLFQHIKHRAHQLGRLCRDPLKKAICSYQGT